MVPSATAHHNLPQGRVRKFVGKEKDLDDTFPSRQRENDVPWTQLFHSVKLLRLAENERD
jgi:hypothetical protein